MLAVIDARSPEKSIINLESCSKEVHLFASAGITYNSISGHPDIFMFQYNNTNIIAPNSPSEFTDFLKKYKINYKIGNNKVGDSLKNSVSYNCVATEKFLIHKKYMTDPAISEYFSNKTFLNLPQAYTRCSLINLGNGKFITSDHGIKKALDKNNLTTFYFKPDKIQIEDHINGFIGGTCGIYKNKIFFNGNIFKHESGEALNNFLIGLKYEVICLHDEYLYDGGCIFFF